jgi:hypothetical protein
MSIKFQFVGSGGSSEEAHDSRRSSRYRFCLAAPTEAIPQSQTFFEYVDTVFVPHLNELRGSAEFRECEAVLLMDNCSPHIADEIVALLTSLQVRIITFAPHTTHIFHVLDVVLFHALKKRDKGLKDLD